MPMFVLFAALMLAIALTFVLRPLLTRRGSDDSAELARRRVQVLDQAHAAGLLSDALNRAATTL